MMFLVYLLGLLAVAYGCSIPEGGYKEPTPADNVYYAKHVVVGEVTEILRPDPMFNDMYGNSTYGAMVTVQCTYKGGPLSGRITIGGAGFIPGHCTSMDVEVGKHYVLFLKGKQEGDDFYEQSPGQTAAPKSKLMDYLNVCDLYMEYPQEHGMMINRPVCPPASKLDTCKRRGDTKHPEVVTVKSKQHDMQEKGVYSAQPASGDAKESKADDNNNNNNNDSNAVVTSICALIFCVLCHLI